jgi:hypothetical protein
MVELERLKKLCTCEADAFRGINFMLVFAGHVSGYIIEPLRRCVRQKVPGKQQVLQIIYSYETEKNLPLAGH